VLIRELLLEDDAVTDQIVNDLMDMITAYLSRKLTVIPMNGPSGMIPYLTKLGYHLVAQDLMTVLDRPEFADVVERSDPHKIQLKSAQPSEVGKSQLDKSKDKVERDAQQIATKNVKAGDQM
jgi:hypothetical protein